MGQRGDFRHGSVGQSVEDDPNFPRIVGPAQSQPAREISCGGHGRKRIAATVLWIERAPHGIGKRRLRAQHSSGVGQCAPAADQRRVARLRSLRERVAFLHAPKTRRSLHSQWQSTGTMQFQSFGDAEKQIPGVSRRCAEQCFCQCPPRSFVETGFQPQRSPTITVEKACVEKLLQSRLEIRCVGRIKITAGFREPHATKASQSDDGRKPESMESVAMETPPPIA